MFDWCEAMRPLIHEDAEYGIDRIFAPSSSITASMAISETYSHTAPTCNIGVFYVPVKIIKHSEIIINLNETTTDSSTELLKAERDLKDYIHSELMNNYHSLSKDFIPYKTLEEFILLTNEYAEILVYKKIDVNLQIRLNRSKNSWEPFITYNERPYSKEHNQNLKYYSSVGNFGAYGKVYELPFITDSAISKVKLYVEKSDTLLLTKAPSKRYSVYYSDTEESDQGTDSVLHYKTEPFARFITKTFKGKFFHPWYMINGVYPDQEDSDFFDQSIEPRYINAPLFSIAESILSNVYTATPEAKFENQLTVNLIQKYNRMKELVSD